MPHEPATVGTDNYLEHLGACQAKLGVVAATDIVNAQGMLLAKKGSPLSAAVVARMLGQRLKQSVDTVVTVGATLNGSSLHECINAVLSEAPECQAVHRSQAFADELQHHCHVQEYPFSLLNRLTVMRERLPVPFAQSLLSAWWCCLLARELGWSMPQRHLAFVAGLFHDIGLVHIEPELAAAALTSAPLVDDPDARRRYLQHIPIACALLQGTGVIADEVIQAVAQHHERDDGSGLPRALAAAQLGELGQMVGLSDTVLIAIGNGKGSTKLADLVPYLRLHGYSHRDSVCQAALRLLQQAGLLSGPAVTVPLHGVRAEAMQMGLLLARVLEIASLLDALPAESALPRPQQLITHLLDNLRRSGLISGELALWLGRLRSEELDQGLEQELAELDKLFRAFHEQMLQFCDQLRRDIEASPESARKHYVELSACVEVLVARLHADFPPI